MNRTRALRPATLLMAMAVCVPAARAQVHVGSDTVVQLSADASVGYVQSSAQGGLNSLNFGLSADLNGYYYHPNFLQFQFSPYYNQGREYSAADFIAGNQGFSAGLNLFSGGNLPLVINYSRMKNSSGLYGLVGSQASVVGEGSSDNLSINWSLRFPRFPALQLGYIRSGGDYRIFGSNGSFGQTDSNGYFAGIQHRLLGFSLAASYNSQDLDQLLPRVFLTGQQNPRAATRQRNIQFSANRQLSESSFLDVNVRRSQWTTTLTSQPQQREYDTVSAGLSARPLERLTTSFRFHYVSNLNALLIGSVLPGSTANPADASALVLRPQSETTYLTYTSSANYQFTRELSFRSGLRRGIGRFAGKDSDKDTAWNNALAYRHNLLGGLLTTGYTMGLYRFENGSSQSSSRAHAGMMTFSKMVFGCQHSGVFQYSTSDIESLLPGQLRMLSTELASSGSLKGWRLTAAFRYEKGDTIFNTQTKTTRRGFRLSLTRGGLNLAGSLQFGSGLSILSVTGSQPAAVSQVIATGSEFDRLLIPNDSSSFSLTATYQLGKRTSFQGGWSRLNSRTFQAGSGGSSQLSQFDFHVRHWFRRLDCRAGYRRYHQAFSLGNGLYNANTVYFQVSRHFDVF